MDKEKLIEMLDMFLNGHLGSSQLYFIRKLELEKNNDGSQTLYLRFAHATKPAYRRGEQE